MKEYRFAFSVEIREASNDEACANFETRTNNIKAAMRNRTAPQQQFEELAKIERTYFEILI